MERDSSRLETELLDISGVSGGTTDDLDFVVSRRDLESESSLSPKMLENWSLLLFW